MPNSATKRNGIAPFLTLLGLIGLILLNKILSDRFVSGRYAAKEAVLKCLGTGMKDGTALTEVQILQASSGQPIVQIDGEVEKIARQLGIISWHISISHTPYSSTAFVVAEG